MEKKKGKIKSDRQTVVLGDISSKLSLVLEQFSGVNKKIDNNHKEFLEFKGDMIEFRGEMIKFRNEMYDFRDKTDKNLKIALEYLFRIDEEIQDLKTELKDLRKIFKGKADLEKLNDFEKRLLKLERLVFAKLVKE
ncbi:MAG TPA: hypothetical protein DIT25_04660 [Candidatus Moranbacteria bacterium]|nr:hypothetical protein [Candidatus Moranbacteria bacterium]